MKLTSLAVSVIITSGLTSAQVVQWDIKHHRSRDRLSRRSETTIEAKITNSQSQGGYFATVEIGTPGQRLSLQLDTGSSDVWLPYKEAEICQDTNNGGCRLGTFDPSKSSTFDNVGRGLFDISYQDDDKSTGDYFTDVFTLGNTSIKNFTMGLGKKTTVPYGLIGVGYANNEASTETANTIYPNLPVAMQQSGLINSIAYSLWLNDLDASSGSIIFGGIDTAKYVGSLTKIPVLRNKQANNFTHFVVSMYSLEATSPSGSDALMSNELPLEVVLDSGTTLTYLPDDLATQIWDEVGAVYDSDSQAALIPCSYAKHNGHFSFALGTPSGPRINITMDELVLDITDGEPPRFGSGSYAGRPACAFGIQNTTQSPYLLGDTFLRSAYVVYDLVNNQVGIAATDFNSTGSNIVAFPSNGAAIPSATMAPANNQSTSEPQPTSTGQSAAKGFQEDNAGSSMHSFSAAASTLVGMLTFYKFVDSMMHDF